MIANIFTAVSASAYLTGIEQYLGAEFLDVNTAAQRMVWFPTADTFDGGRGRQNIAIGSKISKRTRFAGVTVRIWAKSSASNPTSVDEIRAVEQLLNKLIVALHDLGRGSYDIQGCTWQTDGQQILQYGRTVDLQIVLTIPVYKSDDDVLTVDNQTTTTMTTFVNANQDGTLVPFGGSV